MFYRLSQDIESDYHYELVAWLCRETNDWTSIKLFTAMNNKIIYHINYGVKLGFPVPRKAVTTQVKRYDIFSRVFDVANQLLTRHSPFSPLG